MLSLLFNVYLSLFLLFLQGSIGVFETLGAEFTLSHFGWGTLQTGYTFAFCGFLGVLTLFSFNFFSEHMNDFDLIICGIAVMSFSCFMLGILSSSVQTGLGEFYVALGLMYALGYPLGHTAVLGMVSKLTDHGPQGAIMGWFAAAGSLARIVFPLMSGPLAQVFGDNVVFGLLAVMLAVSLVFTIQYRRISD
jgi:MFS transporter, ceroid-lipofuscinosis neuronal protein 7